ncbi:MAG: hypothetical protein IKN72_02085 [Clostridia bacterium]|nr:hypothetical protein [Clostridia bacterium]
MNRNLTTAAPARRTKRAPLGKQLLALLLALMIALSCAVSASANEEEPQPAAESVVVQARQKAAFPKAVYQTIRKELNAELKTRNFAPIVNTFLREILYYKCKFYSQWSTVYPDLPDLESYLRENFLGALANAQTIHGYDENSRTGRLLQAQDNAAGITDADFNVRFYYTDPEDLTPAEHLVDLEVLDHELKHCKDKKVTFRLKPFENNSDLSDIMIEGGATFHEQFVYPVTASQDYAELIANKRQTRQLAYGKSTGAGYFLYLYLYNNLVYLAGYRTVENVSLGEPIAAVRTAMAKKYGKNTADQIWVGLKKLKRLFETRRPTTDPYQYAIKLQNLIFKCINKDIKRLDDTDPAAVSRYLEAYRFYKMRILPQLYDENFDVKTDEVFDTAPYDRRLIKKIVACGALPQLSSNEALNEMALLCLLFTSVENYGTTKRPCYVAPTVAGTKMKVTTRDVSARIQMVYADGFGNTVRLTFHFNADGWDVPDGVYI